MKSEANKTATYNDAGPELVPRLLAKLRVEVPGYQLLDEIGSGGQATVYRARELTSGLTVAIKILHAGPNADQASRERFRRETAALKALNHPNIVCVIESGQTPAGLDFLVMNYVDGKPLDVLWKDRKLAAKIAPEPPARLRLFKKICDIVQAAHRAGITHRDLSPSNILLDDRGEPQVLDFGLAATAFDSLMNPEGRNVTVTGQFIGKLKYASPEQARGTREAIDIRTDVYALGVILYQILTHGAFPYEVVGNVVDVLNNIIHSKPMPPSAILEARAAQTVSITPGKANPIRHGPALINGTIEAVVLKALEKNPSDRYESAGALGEDIERYLAGTPTTAKPKGLPQVGSKKPSRRFGPRGVLITSLSALVTIGVLMNARTILNFVGLSTFAVSLGLGATTNSGAPQLTSLQQNLLLQLSDAEANIQALNKALKVTGYNVGVAYDQLDNSQHANEIMNRKGGGPVRWDEFYGKTAKDYGSNGWGDYRPQQFAYVYQANNDQISRAQEKIAALAQDQAQLLARRGEHEADQSRLWAKLAWNQVKDREIALEPICRYALKPAGSPAAVLRPVILFLRTADAIAEDGLSSIDADQAGTFQQGNQRMGAAYAALQLSLADALDGADLRPDQVKEGKALKAICKGLSEDCQVIALNYTNALDRDKAKEDSSKLEFRGQLQTSLADFATEVGQLDDEVGSTARAWGVSADRGTATADAVIASGAPAAGALGGVAASGVSGNYSAAWTNLLERPTQEGETLQPGADGVLAVADKGYFWAPAVSDAVIRAKVNYVNGRHAALYLRKSPGVGYGAYFNGGDAFGIGAFVNGTFRDLGDVHSVQKFSDFFAMQFSAIGDRLTLSVNGQELLSVRNDQVPSGPVGFGSAGGKSFFKDVQVQVFDQGASVSMPGAAVGASPANNPPEGGNASGLGEVPPAPTDKGLSSAILGAWKVTNTANGKITIQNFDDGGICVSNSATFNRPAIQGHWREVGGEIESNWDNGTKLVFRDLKNGHMTGTAYKDGTEDPLDVERQGN